jgi:ribonuclease P protein component
MLAKQFRFHGSAALRWLYKAGGAVRTQHMSLRFRSQNAPGYRAAIVVSKKVSKSAVVRNRIRRRLYESLRTLPKPVLSGYALLITVYDESLSTMPTAKMHMELTTLLSKARILSTQEAPRDIVGREGK